MRHPREQNLEETPVDPSLCGELYQLYAPRLLAYLCHYLPSPHDAEDTLLDVFLVALEREVYLRTLAPEQRCAWLWTVARNRMVDHYRQQKRKPQISLHAIEEMEDEQHLPERELLRLERDEHMHSSISRLSPLQQEVLSLRFAGGLRCTEIAAVLNKQDGAVRALLTRALQALRNIHAD